VIYDVISVSNGRMIGERWTGKDLEESDRSLLEILSQYMPRGTEENYEKPEAG
jgi:hypothetical protein